jgi:drug/metabolite transporter (DMT)-like permease
MRDHTQDNAGDDLTVPVRISSKIPLMKPQMNRLRADALLLLVAVLWGTTFVAQKEANGYVGPIFFVAVRFSVAAIFLMPLALWESRRPNTQALTRTDWFGGVGIGACLCSAQWMQQTGLTSTTATNAGFLTAIYMVVVPFVAWIVTRRAPRPFVLLACAVAMVGAWLLEGGTLSGWSNGDAIILGSDFIWALHIALIAHFQRFAARPMLLSCLQCGLTGLVSLPAALLWQPAAWYAFVACLPAIIYGGIVSSGIAFTLQIVAQRHTPPAEAALIMSLESVFAAITGAIVLHEMLSWIAMLGAFLIMAGVVLIETGPLISSLLERFRLGRDRETA